MLDRLRGVPHIIIEYSANVNSRVGVADMVHRVHRRLLDLPFIPTDGLRTRAFAATEYAVADQTDECAYIAVYARLGPGRTAEQRSTVIDAITDEIVGLLGDHTAGVALSVEYQEIDPTMRRNSNFIRVMS